MTTETTSTTVSGQMHKIWYERETSNQIDAQIVSCTMLKESMKQRE